MKSNVLGAVALSFAALSASAQAPQVDSYTGVAKGMIHAADGRSYHIMDVTRRDSTAAECLSNFAIFAAHPQMTEQKAVYEGRCTQDFPAAGKPAVSFAFVCDANKAPAEVVGRLFEAGKRLHWQEKPADVDAADVKAVCTTTPANAVEPALRLTNPAGLAKLN